MAGAPIDYEAIARKAREMGGSTTPPFVKPGSVIDYEALAAQAKGQAGPAAVANKPAERGWMDEATDFAKGALVDTAKGITHTLGRLVPDMEPSAHDEVLRTVMGPAGPLLGDVVSGHWETAKKAKASFEKGDNLEGAGYAAAAALPILGPAAAGIGEQAAATNPDGTPMPGAIARAAGQVAGMAALPEMVKRAPAAMGATADILKESSKREYAQVLGATTKGNKLRSERIVPELIDRRVMSPTLKGLSEKANTSAEVSGQAISDAFDKLPAGSRVNIDPIVAALERGAEESFLIRDPAGALIPMSEEAARGASNMRGMVDSLQKIAEKDPVTGGAFLTADTARRLRQYYDRVTKDAGGFEGKNLADKSVAAAHEAAADAIREQLAREFPDIAKLNKEYSFWRDVGRVVDDSLTRKQGQARGLGSKIAGAAGAAGGFSTGGLTGAIVGKFALESLDAVTRSPAWRTISSVTKDRLADALSKGNHGAAEKIIQSMRAAMVLGAARNSAPAKPMPLAATGNVGLPLLFQDAATKNAARSLLTPAPAGVMGGLLTNRR